MTAAAYLSGLRMTDQTRAAILALVNRLAPARRHRWEFWRSPEDHRYRLAFELVNFYAIVRR